MSLFMVKKHKNGFLKQKIHRNTNPKLEMGCPRGKRATALAAVLQ